MPIEDRHRKQRGKNLLLLALLVAFIAIVYMVTIIKMDS